jgi:hypothetical protein
MADTPEIFPRLGIEQLAALHTRNNSWLGVTPHFSDGSELLDLVQLRAFLGFTHRQGKLSELRELGRTDGPVAVLDRRMSTHGLGRSIFFNSHFNATDSGAETNAMKLFALKQVTPEEAAEGKTPYNFPSYTEDIVKGIIAGVASKQEERTRSLLEKFMNDFNEITDTSVWVRGQERSQGRAAIFAAQLAGFTIHGSGKKTVIEPIVLSDEGEKSVLPIEDFQFYSQLNLRIKTQSED